MEFSDKTVLITGGASGIGALLGECCINEGANVVLVDKSSEGLSEVKNKINNDRLLCITADVSDYAQAEAACRDAVQKFGRIDIVVPCAGGAEGRLLGMGGNFIDLPITAFDFSVDLNLKGAVYFAHAAMKYMAKQKSGVVIFLGSITGAEGCSTNVGYAASKSALMNGVVKSVALCGAQYNIRACCVAPGPVLTRPSMSYMSTLVGRAAKPQEIVDMIMYLASSKGSFVNGTTILIDGGRFAMFQKN